MAPDLTIREATPEDAELVASFITELAEYERLEAETAPRIEALKRDLGEHSQPRAYALIAEIGGHPVGMAMYYAAYSTNQTRWNLHLQDIFVREECRGQHVGETLMQRLAAIAQDRNYGHIELEVLTWNEAASGFYEKMGAVANPETTKMYIEGEALGKLAHTRQ